MSTLSSSSSTPISSSSGYVYRRGTIFSPFGARGRWFWSLFTESSTLTKLSIVGLLVMLIFYLYASTVVHEPTRKSLFFGQMTIILVILLYFILFKYLYPILFTYVDWSRSKLWRKWEYPLRILFQTFAVCVLSVYPLGRGVVAALPPTSEPYTLLLIVFSCFGSFCILFTLTIFTDILIRIYWLLNYVFVGRRFELVNHIILSSQRSNENSHNTTITSTNEKLSPSTTTVVKDDSDISGSRNNNYTTTPNNTVIGSTSVIPSSSVGLKHRLGSTTTSTSSSSATGSIVPSSKEDSSFSSSSSSFFTSLGSILRYTKRPAWFTVTIIFSTIFISIYSLIEAQQDPQIVYVEIPLTRLPKDLDGFRIVQLSDIHIGPTVGASRLQRVVDQANTLDGDINVLTGDFFDGDEHTYRPSIQPLQYLTSRTSKTYFVSGNHEYYDGHFSKKMFILRELGIHILYNERIEVPEYRTDKYPYPRNKHTDYCKTCSSKLPFSSSSNMGTIFSCIPTVTDETTSTQALLLNSVSSSSSSSSHRAEEVFDSSVSRVFDQVREIIDTSTGLALSRVSSEVPLVIDQREEEDLTVGKGGQAIKTTSDSETVKVSSLPIPEVSYSTFDLAGIPDYAASILAGTNHKYNISLALMNRDVTRELVLLAHQPKHIHETSIYGVGLQLSGHTHGGQIGIPLGIPVYFANPYFASLYKHESYIPGNTVLEASLAAILQRHHYNDSLDSDSSSVSASLLRSWWPTYIYVSRGTLYWGPPMRIAAKHEITCITLRSTEVVGTTFEGVTTTTTRTNEGWWWWWRNIF